jgi:hypothetical protein
MGKLPRRVYRRIYLAEWLQALGHEVGQVAAAAKVDQSYTSSPPIKLSCLYSPLIYIIYFPWKLFS